MGKKYKFNGEIEEKSGGSVVAWILIILFVLFLCGISKDKSHGASTSGTYSGSSR